MTHLEIEREMRGLVLKERKITNEILKLINLAFDKKTYLERGYSSLYEWLTKGFGYSNAAAFRRIEAAKLLRVVPEVAQKLEDGEVNLTTLAQLQSAVKAQEKATGKKVTIEERQNAIEKIENKSSNTTQHEWLVLFPQAGSSIHQDRKIVINESTTRLSINLSKNISDKLQRAKELLSHKLPNASDAEIIGHALNFLLEKTDPLNKESKSSAESEIKRNTSAPEVVRVKRSKRSKISVQLRREIIQKAEGQCQYLDPITNKKCQNQYQLEIDHIYPKALGGSDDPRNLSNRGHGRAAHNRTPLIRKITGPWSRMGSVDGLVLGNVESP